MGPVNNPNPSPAPMAGLTPFRKGEKNNNWFAWIIETRGKDYFDSGKLTSNEVSKNAERIINDIIRGNIDYNLYGQYIISPVVLDTLISYCNHKIEVNAGNQYALAYTYNAISRGEIITVSNSGLVSVQKTVDDNGYVLYPGMVDNTMIQNILQAMQIANKDLAIYQIINERLSSVNITKNPFDLYNLTNLLSRFINASSKR